MGQILLKALSSPPPELFHWDWKENKPEKKVLSKMNVILEGRGPWFQLLLLLAFLYLAFTEREAVR